MRSGRPTALVVLGVIATLALALAHRDEIHDRAVAALGRGMPDREAELARGFVLGEDDRVDAATVEDFRRSGLAHLLAVSGQNVALLALLAMPLLAALGMPLRTRLVWVLAAIIVYVPLAGAGPSILRAGVMGGLSVLATLAGRRSSRLYGLALAAIVTLAIEPRIGADVGWQLSFAAVLGILALAPPLRRAIGSRLGGRGLSGALAEATAVTVAATMATAPLIAFHFEAFSTTSLLANLLALPAVAPAMWLGMVVAIAGQVPGFPVEALNAVEAPLLAYIAQVAAWCGRPRWAYPHVELGIAGLIIAYASLAATTLLGPYLLRRHRLAASRTSSPRGPRRRNALWSVSSRSALRRRTGRWIAVLAVMIVLACVPMLSGGGPGAAGSIPGLRLSFLDVGQGDAILLQPARTPAVLVDGGPPGEDLAAKLSTAGVERLGVAIISHEQSDHAGGVEELLGRLPVAHLGYARLSRRLRGEAGAAGTRLQRLAAGDTVRSGSLHLEVLWPPPELLAAPLSGADPNAQALVFRVRWHDFTALLTADAEAEAVPIDPGPVDVLKVAHHGSEDAGLGDLLGRTSPHLAVISAGAGNPFGHPTAATLATLSRHAVPTLRTDRDGPIVLGVRRGSFELLAGG